MAGWVRETGCNKAEFAGAMGLQLRQTQAPQHRKRRRAAFSKPSRRVSRAGTHDSGRRGDLPVWDASVSADGCPLLYRIVVIVTLYLDLRIVHHSIITKSDARC